MGIPSGLGAIRKLAIIFIVFAGHVGPIALAFSWRSARRKVTFAGESVMVG
jgi:hypothetical protein